MYHPRAAAPFLLLTVPVACGQPADAPAELETGDQRASYGIGLNIGQQLEAAESRLDLDAFMAGVGDAMAGREPQLSGEEINLALQTFSSQIQEAETQRRTAEAQQNRAEGEAYLAENGARSGVTTTESGLQYEVLVPGDGPRPSLTDRVSLHYEGSLIDGTIFDSSRDGPPVEFGVGGMIDGFTEALQLIPVGGTYRVVIPSDLGYGPMGGQPGSQIGPDATLIFEIEVLAIL